MDNTQKDRTTKKWDMPVMYLVSLLFMICNMLPNPIIAGYSVFLGASAGLMSMIGGLNSFCALVSRPFVGNMADRLNSRKLMLAGLVIMGAGSLLHLFAFSPYVLALGRVVNGIGFTCCSVCIAIYLAFIRKINV